MEYLARDEQLAAMAPVEPWAVLPCQLARESTRLPEQELMLAVLREAIDEYREALLHPGSKRGREVLELRRWFSSEDVEWPFSFRNLCEVLDIDRELLRARLVAWRRGTQRMDAPRGRIRLAKRSMRGSKTRVCAAPE